MRSSLLCTHIPYTFLCLWTCRLAKTATGWSYWRNDAIYQALLFHKAIKSEIPLLLPRPSLNKSKHFFSWMIRVNRKVAVSTINLTDHFPVLGLCYHHLQTTCCKPKHSGFFVQMKSIWKWLVAIMEIQDIFLNIYVLLNLKKEKKVQVKTVA